MCQAACSRLQPQKAKESVSNFSVPPNPQPTLAESIPEPPGPGLATCKACSGEPQGLDQRNGLGESIRSQAPERKASPPRGLVVVVVAGPPENRGGPHQLQGKGEEQGLGNRQTHVVETRFGAQKWGLQRDPRGRVGQAGRDKKKCPDVTQRIGQGWGPYPGLLTAPCMRVPRGGRPPMPVCHASRLEWVCGIRSSVLPNAGVFCPD